MAIALVTNTGGGLGVNGGTSASIDTSGANLLIVCLAYQAASNPALTDSKSNTWTPLTAQENVGGTSCRLWYSKNPTVGSGHTITVTGTGTAVSGYFASFSGCDTTAPFDLQNGAKNTTITTLNSGSLTPSANNYLVISGCGMNTVTAPTVSLLTMLNSIGLSGGVYYGGGLAYEIQTTATARNPLWTMSTSGAMAAVIASFKVSAGSSSVTQLVTDSEALSDATKIEDGLLFGISDTL